MKIRNNPRPGLVDVIESRSRWEGRLVWCHGNCGKIIGVARMETGWVEPRYGCGECKPARDPRYVAYRIVDSWVANGYRFVWHRINKVAKHFILRGLEEEMSKYTPLSRESRTRHCA